MWLLLIIAVALLWLISRSRGNALSLGSGANSVADSGVDSGDFLSELQKIPAGLPGAVAQVESGNRQFDENGKIITSPTGALGIMQLEPATAADLGVDPYDPEQNVEGGTRYLQQLYDEFNGNLNDTLAAYNWGPGNVERAKQAGEPYPRSVLDYVRKVLANLGGTSA